MRIDNKVAIVTGAGRGIGRVISTVLAEAGADIVAVARTKEEIEETCRKVEALGKRGLAITTDVSKTDEVERMVAATISQFKKIDILVNNAGISQLVPAFETTEELWDSNININLKGTFLCNKAAARQMVKQGGGKIVNIVSIASHEALPGNSAYSASKGGVLQLTKVLAMEWAKYNINVNAVSPGVTKTPLIENITKTNPDFISNYFKRIPSGRPAKPESIANAVLFLSSSASDDIFGQEIVVDGGITVLHAGYVEHN